MQDPAEDGRIEQKKQLKSVLINICIYVFYPHKKLSFDHMTFLKCEGAGAIVSSMLPRKTQNKLSFFVLWLHHGMVATVRRCTTRIRRCKFCVLFSTSIIPPRFWGLISWGEVWDWGGEGGTLDFEEISKERTHGPWTPKKTWVSNSLIATYLGFH